MTVQTAVAVSLLRCVVVAIIALFPAAALASNLRGTGTAWRRKLLLAFVAVPLLTPELLTGFVYRQIVAQISEQWFATELLYSVIVLTRCTSIGAIVLWIQPARRVPASSRHSARLMLSDASRAQSARSLLFGLRRHDFVRRLLPTLSLMLLVAFQEFEIAALLQIDRHPIAWTVTLFDAHAGGEALWKSMTWTILPVGLELLTLLPVLILIRRRGDRETDAHELRTRPHHNRMALSWLVLPVLLFIAWPVRSLADDFVTGIIALGGNLPVLALALEQIGVTLAVCCTSAIVAMALSFAVTDRLRTSANVRVRFWLVPLLLPGLAGSLVISLCLLAVFQLPILRLLYDTPVPQVLGLVLLMLPRCLLLGLLLDHTSPSPARHSVRMLGGSGDRGVLRNHRNLAWRVIRGPRFWATALVTFWCSWDVTTASLLRPVAMEPVVTRLYNEMHYQRNEYLTTVAVLAVLIPLAAAVVIRPIIRRLPGSGGSLTQPDSST